MLEKLLHLTRNFDGGLDYVPEAEVLSNQNEVRWNHESSSSLHGELFICQKCRVVNR